jgi:hypothetical protein
MIRRDRVIEYTQTKTFLRLKRLERSEAIELLERFELASLLCGARHGFLCSKFPFESDFEHLNIEP